MNIKNHKGIGLLELVLAIIVIVSIILMSTRYYITVREKARVASAVSIINSVANASYQWVEKNDGNFGGITSMTVLTDDGFLPTGYGTNDNPWGGSTSVDGTSGSSVVLTMTNIPDKSCTALLDALKKTTGCSSGTLTISFAAP